MRISVTGGGPLCALIRSRASLVQRITAENAALRMPPEYSGLKLTKQEIERLTAWIAQGAPWTQHWSFLVPKRPTAAAKSMQATGLAIPIDSFVLARLEKEGLQPSPEADRADADPPVIARSDGLAPHAAGDRRLHQRPIRRMLMRRLSIACLPHRAMASGWRSAGSMRRAMPTRTGIRWMASARCGAGATG